MHAVISIQQLNKTYASGHPALQDINLDIRPGEIFALLGPNGAEIGRASCRERV